MKKKTSFARRIALACMVLTGLMGPVVGLLASPTPIPIDEWSHKVEMVEIRFLPTSWWGF